jgi:molybdate transport system regulatory protein
MTLSPKTRLWLSKKEKSVMGEGRYELLREIDRGHSLKVASTHLGISYKHAWGMIRDMEEVLGFRIVISKRGGKEWGSTVLTEKGRELLTQYEAFTKMLDETIHDRTFWEEIGLKMSARNILKGKIVEMKEGDVATEVILEVEKSTVAAVITTESARNLRLKVGDRASAIIKATDVMVGKE